MYAQVTPSVSSFPIQDAECSSTTSVCTHTGVSTYLIVWHSQSEGNVWATISSLFHNDS